FHDLVIVIDQEDGSLLRRHLMDSLRLRCATNVLAANQIPIIARRPGVGKGAPSALTYISMRTVVYGNELPSRQITKRACPLPPCNGTLHNQRRGFSVGQN